jgi:hypothetical protein
MALAAPAMQKKTCALLIRSGWQFIEQISMNGDEVEICVKLLR